MSKLGFKPQGITVLTGAGISAESGISTFRDANGLWENHAIEDVASPEGFHRNPKLVLEFYNQRRKQVRAAQPNGAHQLLAKLEQQFNLVVITQNIDDLHERAGSKKVIHLHGEILKARPVNNAKKILDWDKDALNWGDTDSESVQLRPHIVWFGEAVPEIETAIERIIVSDLIIIIGTSLQVYPASTLHDYAQPGTPIFYIDPQAKSHPAPQNGVSIIPIAQKAVEGLQYWVDTYLKD